MGVKVTSLDELIRDLEQIDERLAAEAPKVVAKGAFNIKTTWRKVWTPVSPDPAEHAPHLARGVGYETTRHGSTYHAEIGVHRLNPQAPLAHFAEYGSLRNAPRPGGFPALVVEEPRFVEAVEDLGERLLEGR